MVTDQIVVLRNVGSSRSGVHFLQSLTIMQIIAQWSIGMVNRRALTFQTIPDWNVFKSRRFKSTLIGLLLLNVLIIFKQRIELSLQHLMVSMVKSCLVEYLRGMAVAGLEGHLLEEGTQRADTFLRAQTTTHCPSCGRFSKRHAKHAHGLHIQATLLIARQDGTSRTT